MLVAIPSLSFLAVFCFGCLFWFVCFVFWVVLFLMGLLTGLCIGPLPALLRLPTYLTALQANYNSACLLQLNVCNDLAKAMKASDGRKIAGAPLLSAVFSTRNAAYSAFQSHRKSLPNAATEILTSCSY